MNKQLLGSFSLAFIFALTLLSQKVEGVIVARENFELATTGTLNGQSSGFGFSAMDPWTAVMGITEVVATPDPVGGAAVGGNNALQLTGDNDNAIARNVGMSLTGDFYVSFNIRMTGGSVTDNDFVALWLGEGVFVGAPSVGIKANEGGSGTEDFMGRISGNQEAYGDEQLQVSGNGDLFDYQLVAFVSKEGGSTTYNQLQFWLNPSIGDLATPNGTSTGNIAIESVDRIGFRTVNITGDSYLVDDIIVSTEWEDNFDIVPEPGTSALLLLFSGAFFVQRRRG